MKAQEKSGILLSTAKHKNGYVERDALMRTAKQYAQVTRINLRPEVEYCPCCQMRLRRTCTLGERTIITCTKVLYLIHRGYRCPDKACPGHPVVYRSATADALALPGFTFGLDVLILVGTLRLGKHYTLDEVHWALLERLGALGVSISRREVLYLIETYGALLRAGSEVASDQQWLEQVREQGGMVLSIDGIQPDKGNETVYLVREVLTGRMLLAEPTHDSETEILKRLLAPIQALAVPVQGIVSDAQASLVCAIASLWPKVPHQICQIHALRDASKAIFEQDRKAKLAVRQKLQPKLRQYRSDLAKRKLSANECERAKYEVLDRYAASAQAALHLDGLAPFRYGGLEMEEALDALQSSLEQLAKKGALLVAQANNGSNA